MKRQFFACACAVALAFSLSAAGCAGKGGSGGGGDIDAAMKAHAAHAGHAKETLPGSDAAPPDVLPAAAGGAYGFSHYVYADVEGQIITTLVEGPRGRQVRCQKEGLPCSYLDLKALYESGGAIPPQLEISREELGTLVSQLDQLATTLARYTSIDQACAEGYFAVSEQNPNMGIHMASGRNHQDRVFDPAKPEMLLFAKPGGEKLKKDELGQCNRKGAWTGAQGFQVVGAAYMLPTEDFGDQHPEGFAGPFDNWHVHYYSCIGVNMDLILTKEQCEKAGGHIVSKAGWMIHAYAAPGFDNQLGVFSMWNNTIPPLVAGSGIETSRRVAPEPLPAGAATSSIQDFVFPTIEVAAGQPVVITNSDVVPHTVTAGVPMQPNGEFDSGAISTGESFRRTFDEPGEHPFYCIYHPFMQGKVVVKK
jgi:plastocyanin